MQKPRIPVTEFGILITILRFLITEFVLQGPLQQTPGTKYPQYAGSLFYRH
jgi:hypothetical protein